MKAVIFDLDGTLADSLESIAYCANTALAHLGYGPFEKSDFRHFVGDGARKLLERCLLHRGEEDLEHIAQFEKEYKELFEEFCMYKVEPYDGIIALLEELKQEGILIAVLSNKPHERAVEVVETLFGKDCFDVILGQKDDIPRKPSPDGIYYIAERLNLPLSDIVYVGDTNTDMKTGKAAGVLTIGVLWGFRDRKELEENDADVIIKYPDEIKEYVL